jgi:hypothetical protein
MSPIPQSKCPDAAAQSDIGKWGRGHFSRRKKDIIAEKRRAPHLLQLTISLSDQIIWRNKYRYRVFRIQQQKRIKY